VETCADRTAQKAEQGNYPIAKAWRSISLLATLGKILESVVVERISHAVEAYGLLPTSHFKEPESSDQRSKHSCSYKSKSKRRGVANGC
jgi:hypothetical protein